MGSFLRFPVNVSADGGRRVWACLKGRVVHLLDSYLHPLRIQRKQSVSLLLAYYIEFCSCSLLTRGYRGDRRKMQAWFSVKSRPSYWLGRNRLLWENEWSFDWFNWIHEVQQTMSQTKNEVLGSPRENEKYV